jgi:ketosteroid isomerase-like protein
MASPNVELVRSIYSLWERGDFSSSDWAHPEIDYVIADGPARGRWFGLAGLAEGWRAWLSAWEDLSVRADEYRELDDERVVVISRYSGRGKTSGLDLEQMGAKGAILFHVRNGLVTRIVGYFELDRALADLGLETARRQTSKNEELVRRAFDAFNSGDPSFFLDHYDRDIVMRIWPPNINAGTYHGAEAVERQYSQYFGAFGGTFRVDIEKLVEVGDSVLAITKTTGRGRRSGATVQRLSVFWIATIRAGKIIRIDEPTTLEEACAIVGLSKDELN